MEEVALLGRGGMSVCTHTYGWGVDLHQVWWGAVTGPSQSSKGSRCPPGSLPPDPPSSSLLPTLLRLCSSPPPPAVSLRVPSVGEEESSLMLLICVFHTGGWSTAGVSPAPGDVRGWRDGFPRLLIFHRLLLWVHIWGCSTETGGAVPQFQREAFTHDPMPSVTFTGAACEALGWQLFSGWLELVTLTEAPPTSQTHSLTLEWGTTVDIYDLCLYVSISVHLWFPTVDSAPIHLEPKHGLGRLWPRRGQEDHPSSQILYSALGWTCHPQWAKESLSWAFAGSVGKILSVRWARWTGEREAGHLAHLLDGDNLLDSEANSEGNRAQKWKETDHD